MKNIGHVTYTKDPNNGNLNAVWCHSDYGSGTGKATGNNSESFEGTYKIDYFDNSNVLQASLKLEIAKVNEIYHLKWFNNEKQTAFGVGIARNGVLNAGYKDI